MPKDAVTHIEPGDGWVQATAEAVPELTAFENNGAEPLLVRFQAAQPAEDDNRHGVRWPPFSPVVDFTIPGGAATNMWVRAAWGATDFYIKHA